MAGESIFDNDVTDNAVRIGDTPLSISIYSVEKAPTRIHGKGMLEIIFCLKGSVRFSYAYEEFTLHAGEYISVDRDAYYLYDGRDNLCVSFYFDLTRYMDKYPFICNNLFVCEGLAETTMRYPTREHRQLKGMMIALLRYIRDCGDCGGGRGESMQREEVKAVSAVAERIVDLFVDRFDIFFFHAGTYTGKGGEPLRKLREANVFIQNHMKEKFTIGDLARELNFTEGYTSEYLRKMSIGFRHMVSYIRASASESLLLQTSKTILEISEECGFSDVKYYYSAFQRWYKCTPGEFRAQYGRVQEEKLRYLDLDDIGPVLDGLLIEHYMDIFMPEAEKPVTKSRGR